MQGPICRREVGGSVQPTVSTVQVEAIFELFKCKADQSGSKVIHSVFLIRKSRVRRLAIGTASQWLPSATQFPLQKNDMDNRFKCMKQLFLYCDENAVVIRWVMHLLCVSNFHISLTRHWLLLTRLSGIIDRLFQDSVARAKRFIHTPQGFSDREIAWRILSDWLAGHRTSLPANG